MGRHGADQDDAPQHARETGTGFGDLGPVTDPFLLDALPVRPRRERDAGAPGEDAPVTAEPSGPVRRSAEASPAPWAPRPVVRRMETPFSGPIALPDPEGPAAQPRAEQPSTALHEPAHPAPSAAPPRPAPASIPSGERPTGAPTAVPHSLPTLLGGATPPATRAVPSGTSATADDAEEAMDPGTVGLSGRTLLLSLGVGVLVAVALSVVAILPL